MILFLQKALKSYRSKLLLAVLFIGPISRWWSAIENNRTVLDSGRISITYLLVTIFISLSSVFILSLIPFFLESIDLKFISFVSTAVYIFLLILGFGSFFSSISFLARNNTFLYIFTVSFVLLSIYFESSTTKDNLDKFVNFLLISSLISITFPVVLLTTHYFEFDNANTYIETEGNGNVLILIFDEMSFSYFEDKENLIPNFMPNLVKLSLESTIYSKTATTYPFTDLAIPSLLVGINSVEEQARLNKRIDIKDGPLSTLMNSHRIYSQSVIIDVCDELNCNDQQFSKGIYSSTFYVWLMDFIAIGGHILPSPLPEFFPSLEGTWRNYWEFDDHCFNCYDYLPTEFPGLELTPRDSQGSWFYLYHDEVTHHPWNLDSEGQAIQPKANKVFGDFIFPGCISERDIVDNPILCTDDRVFLRREVYKNGLIEADRRIGEFTQFLKQSNQYEDTMIVITSDHGMIHDGIGDGRRPKTITRARPLAHVPLIVKYPRTSEFIVVDEARSTGQIISSIIKTVGDGTLQNNLSDLNMPIPEDAFFVTQNAEFSFSMKKIFEDTSPPSKVDSNYKIEPWSLNKAEINISEYIQLNPSEGIVGLGYNAARGGASETAVMMWLADITSCSDQILVTYEPNGNIFDTLSDSKDKTGLIWSLVKRELNMTIEEFTLLCIEK